MSELEIIQYILSGRTEYFEELVKKYHTYLLKVGHNYLYKTDEVEDAIQTTYLKAFENLHKFKADSAFKTWLIRIMINECKQANRRINVFRRYQHKVSIKTYSLSYACEQEVINEEVKSQLAKAIANLSPIYKSVVIQRLLVGSSTQDAAQNLGISEEAVKIRLFRAKKQLRVDLLKESDMDQLYSDSQKYPSVFAGQIA